MIEELSMTDFHELDGATCRWLLASEHIGRLHVLEPEGARLSTNYVIVAGALYLRIDADAALDIPNCSPAVFDVDVFDEYSQVGWSIHVGGALVDVTDVVTTDSRWRHHLGPWTRSPRERWIRILPTTVGGRWFRPPERPRVFASSVFP